MLQNVDEYFKSPAVITEVPLWLSALCCGTVVFIILIVFQPFHINEIYGPVLYAIVGGFGLISFLCVIICPWLIQLFNKNFYDAKKWTNRCAIIDFFTTVGLIIIGNFLFLSFLTSSFSLNIFFLMTWQTLVISIFVYGVHLLFENRALKKQFLTANQINKQIACSTQTNTPHNSISITGTGKKDSIAIDIESLLYVESDKNYCHIAYLMEGERNEQIIRATIQSIELQLNKMGGVVRCHRAFLVNTKNISHIDRNSGGYHLYLKGCDVSIPVSRSYTSAVLSSIKLV